MTTRRTLVAAAALLAATTGLTPAWAADPVRVGELFSYNAIAAFAVPYRQGWQLAVQEINDAGGVLGGRPLEIVSRDDGGTPGDAVRVAEELVSRENVSFLFGTFFSHIGLAVADFAKQREVLFIAAEPLTDALNLAGGNTFTFRMRPSTYMQTAMLVDAAAGLDAKRWAIVVPNYEYGQAAAAAFKRLLAEKMPEAEVVVEQYPTLGKLEAGPTIAAIEQGRPDAIFNALFGADLTRFVREGSIRGTFEGRPVLSLLTGEPEYLIPLGEEAPQGWIVTGYPWDQIDDPAHKAFVEAYTAAYGDSPRLASILGYMIPYVIRDMLNEAGSTDTAAMIAALETVETQTPQGPVRFRAIDNQATAGSWVGTIAVEDGKGKMVDWSYKDGTAYLLPESEVLAVRQD
jgi:branched-chain amino acid transport system substrate-binding protein